MIIGEQLVVWGRISYSFEALLGNSKVLFHRMLFVLLRVFDRKIRSIAAFGTQIG